jgi:hypothetical protein
MVMRYRAISVDDGICRVLSSVVVADAYLPSVVHGDAREELIAAPAREI